MGSVKGLQCRECGELYPARAIHVCEMCFGPLEVAYDYDVIGDVVSRSRSRRARVDVAVQGAPADRGRAVVDTQAGFTPLIRATNLGQGARPATTSTSRTTASTRPSPSRIGRSRSRRARRCEFGFETLACASTGNLAGAVAAHAAKAGMRGLRVHPGRPRAEQDPRRLVYAPTLVAVDGNYDDVNRLCSEIADRYSWAFVNINMRPYYSEGSKTLAFEVAEQLGWRLLTTRSCRSPRVDAHQDLEGIRRAGRSADRRPRTAEMPARRHRLLAGGRRLGRGTLDVIPVKPNTIAKSLASATRPTATTR